jgi:hypothetical protein
MSEVGFQHDAYFKICPEIALMVDHTRTDWYDLGLSSNHSSSGDAQQQGDAAKAGLVRSRADATLHFLCQSYLST